MKSSTLIVWLLVAACIAIDLAMIGELQVRRNEWPAVGGIVGLGLAFSQIAFVSLWVVWGRAGIPVRIVSALLSVWGVSFLANYSSKGTEIGVGAWFGLLLLCCIFSVILFVIVRLARYELFHPIAETFSVPNRRSSAIQFSIWGLLSLTTAVGVTLAIIRFAEFPIDELLQAATFFAVLNSTASTLLLLDLILVRWWITILAAVAICPIAGLLLSLHELVEDEFTIQLFLTTIAIAAVTCSVSAVLRVGGGYRLVRCSAPRNARASESSAASGSVTEGQADEL